MKDIITIFYSPLAQVYRAASIADSIGDLQNFINDLIRTVETSEERTWSRSCDSVLLTKHLLHQLAKKILGRPFKYSLT